jgi:methionine-rich copper-binding protein CopC
MKTYAKSLASGALALMLALGVAAEASAHAKLVKSDPAEKGEPSDKKNLELTFSEAISGKLSGAEVTDAGGKKVASTAMADQDNKGLMVMLKDPLKAGDYKVDWHAVASDDGHRTNGTVNFTVK